LLLASYLSLTAFLSEFTAFKEGGLLEEMSGNGITSSGGANSGYRVAMVSGALEVSARLATAEDLDLLVRVLEANKILWTNSVTNEPNLLSRKFKRDFPDEFPSQVAAAERA
jgi:hypothetical protein